MKSYNLTVEHWIPVELQDNSKDKVGLKDLFAQAHEIKRIIPDTPAQGSALLRLLLSISHFMLTSYDLEGNEEDLEDEEEALLRWKNYWDHRQFPKKIVEDFFEKYEAYFDLIHEEDPFLQVRLAKRGTYNSASKITEAESANKKRLFTSRSGKEKETISLEEAALWLPSIIGFDDTASKPSKELKEIAKKTGEKALSPGCGWLGKIGAIYAKGENIFETLMLNSPLIDENDEIWPKDQFCWSAPQERWQERHKVPEPSSFSELMTLYSRLVLLDVDQESERVKGFWLLGGEFFDRENAKEPFTLWRPIAPKTKKDSSEGFAPRRHLEERQAWRFFGSIADPSKQGAEGNRRPGVVHWIDILEEQQLLPDTYMVHFEMPFVTYGDKDFFITNTSSQSIDLYASLLTDAGLQWREEIKRQIEKIDKLAACTGYFFERVALVQGASGDALKPCWSKGAESIYQQIDLPFRKWIASLKPISSNECDDDLFLRKKEEWESDVYHLAMRMCEKEISRIANALSVDALIGRTVKKKDGKSKEEEKTISIFDAENTYRHQIMSLYSVGFSRRKEENHA